jgi:nucleotide-binding universal stress UspA family protein
MTAVTSIPTVTSTSTRTFATAGAEREWPPATAPIIAAVDTSKAGRAAVEEAVILARELEAPLVFVHVRRGPMPFLGAPFYQRRLSKKMERARRVLDHALRIARVAEVDAEAEILEGSPQRRIVEFARGRGGQLVVIGSRRRRFGRSIAWAITRSADGPVVIAGRQSSRLALPRLA